MKLSIFLDVSTRVRRNDAHGRTIAGYQKTITAKQAIDEIIAKSKKAGKNQLFK
jgi:hypothetical protein